jgi:hypothetical protein
MSSESVFQVARSWMDVGSLHKRLFIIFMIFYRTSQEYFAYTLVFTQGRIVGWWKTSVSINTDLG